MLDHLMVVQRGQELVVEVLLLLYPLVVQGLQLPPMASRVQLAIGVFAHTIQRCLHVMHLFDSLQSLNTSEADAAALLQQLQGSALFHSHDVALI